MLKNISLVVDMTGKRFGRLVALRHVGSAKCGGANWLCRCDCGKEVEAPRRSLCCGTKKSCGCWRSVVPNPCVKDISGQKFGRLTALHRSGTSADGAVKWTCRCDCGELIDVIGRNLRKGSTVSCKCYRKENNFKHGYSFRGKMTPEYKTWLGMNKRCYDKNQPCYHRYGGRGIGVCERWRKSFLNFLADVGPRPSKAHSIERINNNKGYCKRNCIWATREVQSKNKENSFRITFKGETKIFSEWARELKMNPITLWSRLKRYGWPVERAFSEPVKNRGW